MKAEIINGRLHVWPSTPTEHFALRKWQNHHETCIKAADDRNQYWLPMLAVEVCDVHTDCHSKGNP